MSPERNFTSRRQDIKKALECISVTTKSELRLEMHREHSELTIYVIIDMTEYGAEASPGWLTIRELESWVDGAEFALKTMKEKEKKNA